MNASSTAPPPSCDPQIRGLAQEISGAPDTQVKRIVAKVDAMAVRGPADALIEPLRQRLRMLRPPRPLRFVRLMFDPLSPLIAPASPLLQGRYSIPRTALLPMAHMVRQRMGDDALEIEAEIAGRTNADIELIERLGHSLWPAAARILRQHTIPESWKTSGLREAMYRPLADTVATLMEKTVPLDILCSETANGLLPPGPERIAALLGDIAATKPVDLSMLLVLLVARLPVTIASIVALQVGPVARTIETALDHAADRILLQLTEDEGTEVLIAAGTLASAGATAARITTLLEQLEVGLRKPQRREQLRALRRRLGDSCKARFTLGLQEELLTPLQNLDSSSDPLAILNLETAARGLRVLAIEARVVGGGATYDFLLRKATETVKDNATRDRLTQVDEIRLVEILSGPDAALELDERHA